jgi:hypothetical protein
VGTQAGASTDLPREVLALIEQRYWLPIQVGALAENFVGEPDLASNTHAHPALISDHGLTHVRDIARTAAELASRNDGVLIPTRSPPRAKSIRQIAVGMTYLHDIGMEAPTIEARRVHPQFAAQLALGAEFTDLIDRIWEHDPGLRARLDHVRSEVGVPGDGRVLLREVLAMSLCHSKSAVPATVLSDRAQLRTFMQRAAFTPLAEQSAPLPVLVSRPGNLDSRSEAAANYVVLADESFAWLVHPSVAATHLADDVIDAARLVRAADALRQRGVSLCTSGGFEICVNPATGEAVYGLRSHDGRNAAVLAVHNPISAAESNIAFARLGPGGDLQIGFNRTFAVPAVRRMIIETTADVVIDIEGDAIESFEWNGAPPQVALVAVPGDHAFTEAIGVIAQERSTRLRGRVATVAPSADQIDEPDLSWLARSARFPPTDARFAKLLAHMADHGLDTSRIAAAAAAEGLRLVTVPAGTEVFQVDTTSPLVVIPLGSGLRVHPRTGSESQSIHPWLPVGVTGVVRGGLRNASVVADDQVEVAVVPADVYLREWFRPYSVEEIQGVVARWNRVLA